MKKIAFVFLVSLSHSYAQTDTLPKIPFNGMDLTWVNGQSRVKQAHLQFLDKQTGETILTANAYVDAYYNYNFAKPIDNTQNTSSTIGRHNEITINLASLGFETNYKNTIGRLALQFGAMQHIINELDPSVNRGKNTGTGNLKFIREAAAGYHFNKWYGINVEAGIFMSYMGLESYVLQDNWNYNRSTVCEFTPFYFQGMRLQVFPTQRFKQEIWIINGWQSYNSFSKAPAIGSSSYYRPNENVQLAANFYLGNDTQNPDTLGNQSTRMRFHHDNSIVARYYQHKNAKGLSQAAFSLNTHYGFQKGRIAADTITAKQHFMLGFAVANRLWFYKNKMAITLRADYLSNGGAYLAYAPTAITPNDYNTTLVNNPNKALQILQSTFTFDVMPTDYTTFRIEYTYRQANMPYFGGRGGTTSPSGWVNGPATINTWKPDLQQQEHRLILALNFRL